MLLLLPLHTQKRGNETEKRSYYKEYARLVSSDISLINMIIPPPPPPSSDSPSILLKLYWRMKYFFRGTGTGLENRIQDPSLSVGINWFGKVHAMSFSDRGSEPERLFL